jgi:metal-dependent HD superfamily phosphatase/phosphodiesterase
MAGGTTEKTDSTLEAAMALAPRIRAAAEEIEQGRSSGPFDRSLRDILTINQHTINNLEIYEAAGRVLLGLDPQEPIF